MKYNETKSPQEVTAMSKNNRFETTYTQDNSLTKGLKMVLVDKETGVNYLFVQLGYAGGLTPLLDADGKPVITDLHK